jgi:hypothetical protein
MYNLPTHAGHRMTWNLNTTHLMSLCYRNTFYDNTLSVNMLQYIHSTLSYNNVICKQLRMYCTVIQLHYCILCKCYIILYNALRYLITSQYLTSWDVICCGTSAFLITWYHLFFFSKNFTHVFNVIESSSQPVKDLKNCKEEGKFKVYCLNFPCHGLKWRQHKNTEIVESNG